MNGEQSSAAFWPLADGEWPPALDDLRRGFAGALNVYRVMAHHPALLRAWQPLRDHVTQAGSLPPRLRELVVLRVGFRLGAEYEQAHHVVRGSEAGLSTEEIRRAHAVEVTAFSGVERVAVAMVDALVSQHAIPAELLDQPLLELSKQQVLDLIVTVGMYVTLALIVRSLAVPIEPEIAARARRLLRT
jgi:4-carboxymuconolactone decarboxylase